MLEKAIQQFLTIVLEDIIVDTKCFDRLYIGKPIIMTVFLQNKFYNHIWHAYMSSSYMHWTQQQIFCFSNKSVTLYEYASILKNETG